MSGLEKITDNASVSVIKFLQANVPKSDLVNIEKELKKDFLLAKKKSKGQKVKKKRKKSRILTRKEKKALGFYAIPRDSVKYSEVVPLNQIWSDYISQMLELEKLGPVGTNKNWEQFTQTIYKADFHGSMMQVVRSKCPSYVGKKGICIMDTKNTFKIVSIDNLVTTIPKKDSVFELYVKDIKICVFGKHLCVRPAERSTKKVKSYLHPDL
ncbi:ribonuclease P protein subunit p29 [Bicyclus anynana]|uniref:Ribonuclease P protein subunit p29 n=1 Tax=Bicyclus anynana TaxID=110368 RepID=A0A6J1N8G6_BICAN|nr:ribonuclease P protein subunit p29 [Bicyclus anynana]